MGCRFEFRTQKLPYERISGNFFDFIDFGHQVRVCKKNHISILAVIQKIWDLHKFGLQIWIQNAKLPYETISGNFSDFIDFFIRSGYAKKGHFPILAVFQNVWDLHKFGLQIWIQNAKITLWKNFRQFFQFHRFSLIRSAYSKKDHFSILAIFQNVWDLHKFGFQIWIHNAKITLWKNFGQFFRFHQILVISCISKYMGFTGMQKLKKAIFTISPIFLHFSILAVIQNIWDLHKFGLQIWIQNAKITLWKNFRQIFRFHWFWSSGLGMQKKVISQY